MMEKNKKRKDISIGGRSSQGSVTRASNNTSRASNDASVSCSQSTIKSSDFTNGLPLSTSALTKGYDLRAHLQQIMTFSDDEVDDSSSDDYSLESYDEDDVDDGVDEELQKLVSDGQRDGQTKTPQPTTSQGHSNSLVPINEEDDIDSDDERQLMLEIKNEVTKHVRQEMKSELDLYKAKMDKLENGSDDKTASGDTSGLYADLDNLDPKLREAIIKMRKLDKILSKRVRREKEVKRDRILLERRIRREIEDLHEEGKEEYKEVRHNEQKFLALELPARHNEGVTVPDEFTGEEVFATQLNEDDYPGLKHKDRTKGSSGRSHKSKSRSTSKQSLENEESDDGEESRGDASSVTSGSVDGKKHRRNKKKKDFIKRNKELAGDASNTIAMTEEEKHRLEELLVDVDKIPDIPEGIETEMDETNPFQLAVRPGEGFHPDQDELRSLTSIDSRLKELMPPDDYHSIASSSLSYVPQHKLFTHTGVKHAVDWESRGERALFQNAEQRDMNERLLAIESELALLHNPEELELGGPHLDEDQLHELIDQCVTSLSHSSMSRMTLNSESRTSFADTESVVSHSVDGATDYTPRSPRSARQEILDNPPHLAPEVLQKLLSEAYNPLSKQLSTLQEEDDEDEETTPIPADVWKLISMEKVCEEPEQSDHGEPINNGMGQNIISARNGFMSRNSSSSSLASAADTGREYREVKPLKLPEIDPSGTLVTQGLNNQRFTNQQRSGSGNSTRTSMNSARNSVSDSKMDNGWSDSRMEIMSLDGDMMSPHPPAGEKREGSASKSRSVTSAGRTANAT